MKDKRSLVGIFAVGGFLGIIVAVLVMVLSRPIRPAAIEIQVPEPTAPLATAGPTMTAAPEVLHVLLAGLLLFLMCMTCRRAAW
jgi:hypothetical protein